MTLDECKMFIVMIVESKVLTINLNYLKLFLFFHTQVIQCRYIYKY